MTSILVKALEDIDFTLSQMEDYFHGAEGMKITKMRKVISDAISLYSQSKEGEDKGNVDIDNLIEYCNDWAGNVGRYWHTDKPFEKAAESMYTPEQVIVDYFKQLENDLFALAAVVSQTENKVGLNTINALIEKVQKVKRESPKI